MRKVWLREKSECAEDNCAPPPYPPPHCRGGKPALTISGVVGTVGWSVLVLAALLPIANQLESAASVQRWTRLPSIPLRLRPLRCRATCTGRFFAGSTATF